MAVESQQCGYVANTLLGNVTSVDRYGCEVDDDIYPTPSLREVVDDPAAFGFVGMVKGVVTAAFFLRKRGQRARVDMT